MPGLTIVRNYVEPKTAKELITYFDQQPWSTEISRRVQHYGYKYDAKEAPSTPSIPAICDDLRARLVKDGYFARLPDEMLVNEYKSGQGIALHTDYQKIFGDTVVSLSLLSEYPMDFVRPSGPPEWKQQCHSHYLPVNSLMVMKGEARYDWKHGIAKRVKDRGVIRSRRVSVTFRCMI